DLAGTVGIAAITDGHKQAVRINSGGDILLEMECRLSREKLKPRLITREHAPPHGATAHSERAQIKKQSDFAVVGQSHEVEALQRLLQLALLPAKSHGIDEKADDRANGRQNRCERITKQK